MTQPGFSELTGVSLGAIKNYETGHTEVGLSVIDRVLACPDLHKYTLWLMTDQVAEDAGQIAPDAKFLSDSVASKKKSA
jgi:transcriptional regulator with XRE-family HTH domain